MRNTVLRVGIAIITLCFCCKCNAQMPARQFIWGINGHPLTQVAYYYNIDAQISQINDLKLKSYRFDVLLDSNGYAKKEQLFNQLLIKLKSNGIMALPVLMQSGLKGLDNAAVYQKSYTQGQNFAARYAKYMQVLEVNNEADNKMMLPGDPSGTKKGDYNIQKSQKIIAAIKGFIDGVKSGNSTIRVTLSVSYIHYYYLQLLKENNVDYDIIGCHWYSNMGPIGAAKPNGDDVLAQMKNRFNKPIWVTEFNHSKGTGKASFAKQSQYIAESIPDMISRGVTGLFIYELYDQPSLMQKDPNEAFYGLVFKDDSGKYVMKDAYQSFRQLIQNLRP
ncbi:glycosyl hydrolase 53 family protein [Mucilaginibacter sp. ZT4R22]|uniref:Glycosyl hydrolase 53 family protein n=1 Tax=Mucilaginibacter pankratovii TaxID=2772110 RepID=A0ABR7WL65_9SPHI|nr:glycosyl hydrolase [Mucilaginibacter pankratovii]MBD1363074.1 glycosyl hydrolase 53 family protein [Mucilaginibacter pankratovii]